MKSMGSHIICDAWGSPSEFLDDEKLVRNALEEAVAVSKATLINLCVHKFSPYGVTATATLAESHIAIHTWPEYGYFAADCFFCGTLDPNQALQVVVNVLQATETKTRQIERGFEAPYHSRSLPRG